MDVYLDDIIIYSDTLHEHIEHVKTVLRILEREKLYLSEKKLKFLCREVKILGRIVDDNGIRMDPEKVDRVLHWKAPVNRDQCRGFIGSVGYLADDIFRVRIPLGVLSEVTGDAVPFRWDFAQQRVFEEAKQYVATCAPHCRVPLDYGPGAPPIYVMTDACLGGIGGVVSQGATWKSAKVAAFFSAKLNPAQCNYAVHEQEMLAGVETMLRHRDILQGAKFTWLTDHKGLIHLLNQKNVSGRQACWLEKIGEFDFEVKYIPGEENLLPDALSRMYTFDRPDVARVPSEYAEHDEDDGDETHTAHLASIPLLEEGPMDGSPLRRSSRVAARPAVAPAWLPKGRRVRQQPALGGSTTQTDPIEGRPVQGESAGPVVGSPPKRRTRQVGKPAETGRPETSREFARRMRDRFVLRGPGERKVGGEDGDTHHPEQAQSYAPALEDQVFPAAQISRVPDPDDKTMKEIRNQYYLDPFFQRVIDSPKQFCNFEVTEGIVRLRLNDRTLVCIPDIRIVGRRLQESIISQAHTLLAHLGAQKTLTYLRDRVWWKTMVRDVHAFCETCVACQTSKSSNQKPYGLLNPLPVPSRPWEAIGIDFLGPLPLSKDRNGEYDSITVIIDLFSSMVHLVPSRMTYTAKEIAELIFAEVYKHHGVPKYIISDRDVLFTSAFWSNFNKLIGAKLKMSSAYHPETDGSTEQANRTVVQMLRACISPNQRDWVPRLPAIEFAINLASSESTKRSPFEMNSGQTPRAMIWDDPSESEYPGVRTYIQKIKCTIMEARDSIIGARVKQTMDANKKRRPSPFESGDLIYLSTKNLNFPKGLARKLLPKYVGPYRIIEDFGNNSYRVDLPARLKQRGIHNVFHAS